MQGQSAPGRHPLRCRAEGAARGGAGNRRQFPLVFQTNAGRGNAPMGISSLFRFVLKRGRALAAIALVGLAAACTPSYNWRELDVAGGHARAAFPAKVESETRDLALGGETLKFTLETASVGEAFFAVGSAPLPPGIAGDPVARRAAGLALMRSLYTNMQAVPPLEFPAYGEDIEVRGKAMGKPGWLRARVWVTDTMLIEAVAAGTEESLPEERAREFLRSVVVKP